MLSARLNLLAIAHYDETFRSALRQQGAISGGAFVPAFRFNNAKREKLAGKHVQAKRFSFFLFSIVFFNLRNLYIL